jgi:hypothetical protein
MRLLISSIAALAAAAVLATAAGADTASTPVATGCPAGFGLLPVSYFEALGPYQAPARIDAAGNGDGYVCAHQLPEAVAAAFCNNREPGACTLVQLGLPLFEFTDDTSPALGAGV